MKVSSERWNAQTQWTMVFFLLFPKPWLHWLSETRCANCEGKLFCSKRKPLHGQKYTSRGTYMYVCGLVSLCHGCCHCMRMMYFNVEKLFNQRNIFIKMETKNIIKKTRHKLHFFLAFEVHTNLTAFIQAIV